MKPSIRPMMIATVRLTAGWVALVAVVLGLVASVEARRALERTLPEEFPPPVAGSAVPLPGVNVALERYGDEKLEAVLTRLSADGFFWVRQVFYQDEIESAAGRFDWREPDRILGALGRHPDLGVIAVLDERPAGDGVVPVPDAARFAAFAGAFAGRYGDRVDVYQVWDEPNLGAHWGGGPVSPPGYVNLLSRAAQAIRAADGERALPGGVLGDLATPNAVVLLAGLAPTVETGPVNLSDVRYLEQVYRAGGAPYFDIAVGKPYGFYTGPDDRRVDERVLNFSRLLLLREVMVANGDGGRALWAGHWGWNALPPGWRGPSSPWGQCDEETQAVYTVAALERARREWPWVGALVLENLQPAGPDDDPRWGFALWYPDGRPRPVYTAVAEWNRGLPDGAPVGGYGPVNRWTEYGTGWRLGPVGAAPPAGGGRVVFRFAGNGVALRVRRRPQRAFFYVTVDGAPANRLPRDEAGRAYVVLYDERPADATVPLADGLAFGRHTVVVTAEGGEGGWPLAGWSVAPPEWSGRGRRWGGPVLLAAAGLLLVGFLVGEGRRFPWIVGRERFWSLPGWGQAAVVGVTVALFWGSAGVAWGVGEGVLFYRFLGVSVALFLPLAVLFSWYPVGGLAAVALVLPFYLCPEAMFYRGLSTAEVLVLAVAVGSVWWRGRRFVGGGWGPVAMWVLAAVVAGVAAYDRWAALFELRAVFLVPALYYYLLRRATLNRQEQQVVLIAWLVGGVAVAVVGVWGYVLGRGVVFAEGVARLRSVYHSPNSAALYLERVWPMLLAFLVWGRGWGRWVSGFALAVVTVALGLTFSRGALLLGMPAAVVAMGWWAGERYRWAAVGVVVVGALLLLPLMGVPRFAGLFDLHRGSTFFRLQLWRSTWAMLREHPLLGVGPGNFQVAYRTRYVLPTAWEEFDLDQPHDIFLDCWARLGLPGLLAGGRLLVAFWRAARQERERSPVVTSGLVGGLAALLAHGLVDNSLFAPDLAPAFLLMLALAGG